LSTKKAAKNLSWKKASTTSPPEADPPPAGAGLKKGKGGRFFASHSAAQTRRLGARIGRTLRAGDVVALSGGLGAGKTTLIQGIVKGLGCADDVSSPTFTLIHEYSGKEKIYHLDWYRLKKVTGTDRHLAEECLAEAAVTLIEWPERAAGLVPRGAVRVRIEHAGGSGRRIFWKGTAL
jgi:tRNA threonylcarbamoyladenosine biosynthesis protein TsaE